jgi:hypothetical protein
MKLTPVVINFSNMTEVNLIPNITHDDSKTSL